MESKESYSANKRTVSGCRFHVSSCNQGMLAISVTWNPQPTPETSNLKLEINNLKLEKGTH